MASPSAWASIQNEPLAPPPPGIVPNLVDPETRAYEIYVAASVCLPLIAIFATMRIYARVIILKRWTWDDCENIVMPLMTVTKRISSDVRPRCGK